MRIVPPIANAAEDGSYRDLSGITPGSKVPAEIFNAINGEIPGFITASGLTPSGSDLAQLTKAARSQRVNWMGTVGGTANAWTLSPSPAFTDWAQLVGVPLRLITNAANTGAVTLAVNGLSAKNVVDSQGNALVLGQIKAGIVLELIYDGTSIRLMTDAFSQATAFRLDTPTMSIPPGVFTRLSNFGNAVISPTLGSSVSASTGIFTVAANDAGWWTLSAGGSTNGLTDWEEIYISVNGSIIAFQMAEFNHTKERRDLSVATITRLNAGDEVSVSYYQNNPWAETRAASIEKWVFFAGMRGGV